MLTPEGVFCIVAALLSLPVAKDIASHFAVYALVNILMAGFSYYDATILLMTFAMLAFYDSALLMITGRGIYFISSLVVFLLAIEQLILGDFLLNNVLYINIIVSALFAVEIFREWQNWYSARRQS